MPRTRAAAGGKNRKEQAGAVETTVWGRKVEAPAVAIESAARSLRVLVQKLHPIGRQRTLPGVDPESDQRVQNIRHSNYTHESHYAHIRTALIDNVLG